MTRYLFLIVFIFNSFSYAKLNIIVSILPQQSFVNAIGKEKVNTTLMVKQGTSPHSYEPKPSQMKDISKADIYLAIGVEFEQTWLQKFANQNKNMNIIDISQNIKKNTKKLDPHIWTSPKNTKVIAKNILDTLVKFDVENKQYYTTNYNAFIKLIEQTDKNIKTILQNTPKNSKFMVFHPAWGYFAKDYNLIQMAIEVDGKNPKPKAIITLIKEAKAQKVKAILTAPEFSTKTAKQIAKAVGVPVIQISPLNKNWSQNLENLAQAIAN